MTDDCNMTDATPLSLFLLSLELYVIRYSELASTLWLPCD